MRQLYDCITCSSINSASISIILGMELNIMFVVFWIMFQVRTLTLPNLVF